MKKIVCIFTAFALMCVLAGCGPDNEILETTVESTTESTIEETTIATTEETTVETIEETTIGSSEEIITETSEESVIIEESSSVAETIIESVQTANEYIRNRNNGTIHYPTCRNLPYEENRETIYLTDDELRNYHCCGNCFR